MAQTLLSVRISSSPKRNAGRLPVAWIRELTAPYLRGYRPRLERNGALCGYWFCAPARLSRKGTSRTAKRRAGRGFFVGYLMEAGEYAYLEPQPPECLVFAFVRPVRGPAHRRLVSAPDALVRQTANYIRWLTHRPPRFVFHDAAPAALTRHQSMRDWPRAKWEHFSRNFFIETLAWLVRSGVVRKLAEAESVGKKFRRS